MTISTTFAPTVTLNSEQRRNLATLLRIYTQYGFTPALCLAAAANAWAESRLLNDAAHLVRNADGKITEWSVGLHQLKVPNGAGDVLNPPGPVIGADGVARPAFNDMRRDPVLNVRALIEQELTETRGTHSARIRAASMQPSLTLMDLSLQFGRYIERHRWLPADIAYRESAYNAFLGADVARMTVGAVNERFASQLGTDGGKSASLDSSATGQAPILSVANTVRIKRVATWGLVVLLVLLALAATRRAIGGERLSAAWGAVTARLPGAVEGE